MDAITDGLDGDLGRLQQWPRREDGFVRARAAQDPAEYRRGDAAGIRKHVLVDDCLVRRNQQAPGRGSVGDRHRRRACQPDIVHARRGGVFRSKGWWERAASAGAIVGLATLVPYWIAASSTPEPGLNKPIHILGSAAVLLVLLVPALERRMKEWLAG
jgi:hypothetical protein